MKQFIAIILFSTVCFLGHSQAPVSQLYLFDALTSPAGVFGVYHPRLLSGFNPLGYNNQPHFINDDELFISAIIPPSTQSDIYLLNIASFTRQQITKTRQSEYSPTLTPDKNHFSFVRVDEVASSSQPSAVQRLYICDFKPQGKISSPLPDIKNIGYHTWIDDKYAALFLVNKPNQLAMVDITSKDPLVFTSDAGRCMTSDERGHLIYVHKITETDWYIKDYDPVLQKATILAETVQGSEDFALLPGGKLIMGKGSKLFMINPSTQKTWSEVADLSYYGITSITRLAFKNNHLVLVNQPK